MAPYQYRYLTGPGAIRLIELQPSPYLNAQVECTVRYCNLPTSEIDSAEHYSALSYVWGDPNQQVTIKLDNCDFSITPNLDSALRHIRDSRLPRMLWADALCINQLDNNEKSIQVQQMWKIYNMAQRTIIYLGDATQFSHEVFTKVHRIPRDFDISLPRLAECFNRPWFSRVWVLQELTFSADPWVYCGQECARWSLLSSYLKKKVGGSVPEQPSLRIFHDMDQIRETFRANMYSGVEDPMTQLLALLDKRRGTGATDARDMIFAHSPMAGLHQCHGQELIGTTSATRLLPNYEKTTTEIYTSVAIEVLENRGIVHLLHMTESEIEIEERDSSLPTWVPDWRKRSPQGQLAPFSEIHNEIPVAMKPPHFSTSQSILYCHGRKVGQVRSVSRLMMDEIALFEGGFRLSYYQKHQHILMPDNRLDAMYTFWNRVLAPFPVKRNPKTIYGKSIFVQLIVLKQQLNSHKDYGLYRRRFGLLDNDDLVLLPALSRPGDIVAVIDSVPFVLRPRDPGNGDTARVVNLQIQRELEASNLNYCHFIGEAMLEQFTSDEDRLRSILDYLYVQNYRGQQFESLVKDLSGLRLAAATDVFALH